MDAAATPLPREETTPPVTKIYFGPIRTVFVRKVFGDAGLVQASKNVGVHRIIRGIGDGVKSPWSAGLARLLRLQELLDAGDIFGHVHAHRIVRSFGDPDPVAILEPAQLFQLLQLFELALGEGGEFEQSAPTEDIEAQMLEVGRTGWRAKACSSTCSVADPGDGRAGEIERVALEIEHDLNHVGVHDVAGRGDEIG